MASLFNIGVSGLRTQQAALAVTGQNITNASTPGYSRQRVEITPENAGFQGGVFEGAGARVERITRITDGFANNQIRLDSALFGELDVMNRQIGQIEGVLLDEAGGLNKALDSFFSALQTASANPASRPFRQLVLSEANALADRFQSLHARLSGQNRNVEAALETATGRINELALGVAELNGRIAALEGQASSGAANSLLDQRDEMLRELATYVSVSVTEQQNNQVSVFIGKGQALVLGSGAAQLEVTAQGEIALRPDERSERFIVTSALKGGEIGGALEFRDRVLKPAINQLGLIAHTVARSVNDAHASGVDLNGDRGGLLFADLNAPGVTVLRALGRESNASDNNLITLAIDDPFQMPTSDYELAFDDANIGSFFVRRLSDDKVVFQGGLGNQLPQSVTFDGMTLTLENGSFEPGDSYLISPLADGAASFAVVMQDPALLAFAGPLRSQTAIGNRGTGEISIGEVFDQNHPIFGNGGTLNPPLIIRFTSPQTYEVLDGSDPANPLPLNPPLNDLPYDPTQINALLPDQLGQHLVRFNGTDIGQLAGAAVVSTGAAALPNGYAAQTIAVDQTDPATGAVIGTRTVDVPANASARQIAALASSLSGVSASASTSVSLTDFTSNNIGQPLEVIINGVDLGPVTSLNDLADRIASDSTLAELGISAASDGATLSLRSAFGDDLNIQVAGDPTDRLTVRSPRGDSLTLNGVGVPGDYRGVSVGGSVTALVGVDLVLGSDTGALLQSNPPHVRADFGFGLEMIGRPEIGDTFTIGFNTDGLGDNRNALSLANLSQSRLIGDPPVSFTESYSELVQFVGVKSSQSRINRDAASALLEQSIAQRESISGVNLDEEAANLIRFEQAYNASAQIIAVAREIFNTLFSVVR